MASKEEIHQEPDMALEGAENVGANGDGLSENVGDTAEGASSSSVEAELPEEVWEVILNMLTDDEDRTNCCRAFPLFDKLLTKSKPVWMFKQVIPFVYPFLGEDQLTPRRICKQWCEDTDHAIITTPGISEQDWWYSFDSVGEIDRFIGTFDGHSRNPFITSAVSITNGDYDGADEYLRKLSDLVSKFGKYIWTLDFRCSTVPGGARNTRPENCYRCLKQILTKTTNLRHLIVYGSRVLMIQDRASRYYYTHCLSMSENPLPAIPSLETMKVRFVGLGLFPQSLNNWLFLPYASHLQSIRTEWLRDDQACQLPKLTHFYLDAIPSNKGLEKLLRLNAPLKQLEIGFRPSILNVFSNRGSITISIALLLRVFHNFPLLEKVAVREIRDFESKAGVDISHLTNSTVQDFTLQFFRGLSSSQYLPRSFNFLRVFKSLQELSVQLDSPIGACVGRNEGEGELQFYKMLKEGQLYESNIWILIPSLKTVRISGGQNFGSVTGNRKEFEEYQARRQTN